MKVGLYARCSTTEQTVLNQFLEFRRFCEARDWAIHREYVDEGVSGTRDKRPALDQLVVDAKRRRFDVVVIWKLDRLGRSLKHLLFLVEELQALGIALVSLGESIDATTPAGRLQFHVLSAVAQFERDRIRERVMAGLQRARAQGKRLGRPNAIVPTLKVEAIRHLSITDGAREVGVSVSTLKRWRRQV